MVLFASTAFELKALSLLQGPVTSPVPDGIWPPYEVFYLEGMLFCTGAGLRAADDVRAALDFGAEYAPDTNEWYEASPSILNGIQALALNAAAVSRYLWPGGKDTTRIARGERLRDGLSITDDSPLKNRDLRNHLEHFDERLDRFCSTLLAGRILRTYVGPIGPPPEVPTYLFRAYYTDVGVFEILGKRFEMQPLLEALQELHDRLVDCSSGRGRLARTPLPPTLPDER